MAAKGRKPRLVKVRIYYPDHMNEPSTVYGVPTSYVKGVIWFATTFSDAKAEVVV